MTSGDSTRAEIKKFDGAPAYKIGPAKDNALYEGLDVNFVDMDAAQFIICTGLHDDQTDQPHEYKPILKEAFKKDLPMICANPDIVVNWGGNMIWCAGAVAQIYERLGGRVVYGKTPWADL